MRSKIIHRLLFFILIVFSLTSSCSSDDSSKSNCFQDENRSILRTVTNIQGIVEGPSELCNQEYVINPNVLLEGQATGLLFPCNLKDKFKEHGIVITFSGYLYETFDTEDICANPFQLTEISKR